MKYSLRAQFKLRQPYQFSKVTNKRHTSLIYPLRYNFNYFKMRSQVRNYYSVGDINYVRSLFGRMWYSDPPQSAVQRNISQEKTTATGHSEMMSRHNIRNCSRSWNYWRWRQLVNYRCSFTGNCITVERLLTLNPKSVGTYISSCQWTNFNFWLFSVHCSRFVPGEGEWN